MRIRRITRVDLKPLARLNTETFPGTDERCALRVFRDCFKNRVPGACLLAEENGRVVGGIFVKRKLTFREKGAHVESFFVDKRRRGKGVGRKLLEKAFAAAKKAGIETLSLTCAKENRAARRLYEKLGFKPFRMYYLKTF